MIFNLRYFLSIDSEFLFDIGFITFIKFGYPWVVYGDV